MAAASSSSTSTSASCLVPSSGRFSVTLLQRERGARPESPLYTSSSPTRPASSSFCTLEKLSYVWQRQNRSVEDLVEDFETKMKSLLLSYEPPDVSSSAGQQGSLRLVVQRASVRRSSRTGGGQIEEPLLGSSPRHEKTLSFIHAQRGISDRS